MQKSSQWECPGNITLSLHDKDGNQPHLRCGHRPAPKLEMGSFETPLADGQMVWKSKHVCFRALDYSGFLYLNGIDDLLSGESPGFRQSRYHLQSTSFSTNHLFI